MTDQPIPDPIEALRAEIQELRNVVTIQGKTISTLQDKVEYNYHGLLLAAKAIQSVADAMVVTQ